MDKVIESLKKLAPEYKSISRIVLFGSRARGDNTENSDYDIAVFGADSEDTILFRSRLEELPTLHRLDVVFVTPKLVGTPIYQSILREGIIIMSKFKQKLENYKAAVARLREAIADCEKYDIDTLRDGAIQRFEFTTELAWKCTREYLLSEGESDINSPKPVMRAALRTGLISDEHGWLTILDDRNTTSHIYDDAQAEEVYARIAENHIALFEKLLAVLEMKAKEE